MTYAEGTRIGRYRIEHVLGRGGMGVVYRAVQEPLGRTVALKVQEGVGVEARDARERFRREWQLVALLDHPNVLPVYDAGEHDGALYIAMRLVEGGDLGKLIGEEGPLAPWRAARLVAQIGEALDAAHARGLLHRDVKPANILVRGSDDAEHAYLTDFGVARRDATSLPLTRTGDWLGTLGYIAPEQLEGKPLDGRADLYSLGCVLFEALTCRPPFARENDGAVLWAHLNAPAPRLSEVGPPVGAALEAVVARALAKVPGERQGSGRELGRQALLAAQTASHTSAATVHARRSTTVRSRRGHRRGWMLAAASLALGGALGVSLLREARDPAPRPTGGEAASAGRIVGTPIKVGRGPLNLVVSSGRVWVANFDDDNVDRLDPAASARVRAPIRVGAAPYALAAGGDGVWVSEVRSGTIRRIDRHEPGRTADVVRVGPTPSGIAMGAGAIWVALTDDRSVARIDPVTHVVTRIRIGARPVHIAVGAGAVWVTTDKGLARLDPVKNLKVGALLDVGQNPTDVAVGAGAVWVTARDDDALVRVDPRTTRIVGRPIAVGRDPYDVEVGAGGIWVTSHQEDTVTRLNPHTGRVVGRPLAVGDGPRDVKVGLGAVWIANTKDGTVSRVQPAAP